MTEPTDLDVLNAMTNYGGSFVAALGGAWMRADRENAARLQAAFPDLWVKYHALASLKLNPETRTA